LNSHHDIGGMPFDMNCIPNFQRGCQLNTGDHGLSKEIADGANNYFCHQSASYHFVPLVYANFFNESRKENAGGESKNKTD
jgi:hypothetical protein